jgi:hypothetical protein
MHFKTIITFDKEKAKNSEEARGYVYDFLTEEGFCNQGMFSSSPADWFNVGGRWSGELQDAEEFFKKANKVLGKKEKEYIYSSDLDKEENKQKLQKFWESLGKKGLNPYVRNQYEDFGYEDDAMILTKELYDKELKEFEGKYTDDEHFWDLEQEEVNKEFIKNKWIVIVDYHS